MPSFDAVLFDWSGTLVHDPAPADRLAYALAALDRTLGEEAVHQMLRRIDDAARLADVVEAMRDEDTSVERHRAANLLWFARAGLDPDLAESLLDFDRDPHNRPLYADAAAVLAALHRNRVKIAVVSDIHLDIRILLERQGVGAFIDEYVLSFEHGCQKPDPRMFLIALGLLGVDSSRTLMVGDRGTHDGGAVAVGIATFILPPPPALAGIRGLDVVARMADVGG